MAWHKLLTARLSNTIKLVGPVVSCEGTPFKGNAASTWKTNPHVQSYTLAMDRVRWCWSSLEQACILVLSRMHACSAARVLPSKLQPM